MERARGMGEREAAKDFYMRGGGGLWKSNKIWIGTKRNIRSYSNKFVKLYILGHIPISASAMKIKVVYIGVRGNDVNNQYYINNRKRLNSWGWYDGEADYKDDSIYTKKKYYICIIENWWLMNFDCEHYFSLKTKQNLQLFIIKFLV